MVPPRSDLLHLIKAVVFHVLDPFPELFEQIRLKLPQVLFHPLDSDDLDHALLYPYFGYMSSQSYNHMILFNKSATLARFDFMKRCENFLYE
jgi:hypothetical protein